jgi:hypothetical protein
MPIDVNQPQHVVSKNTSNTPLQPSWRPDGREKTSTTWICAIPCLRAASGDCRRRCRCVPFLSLPRRRRCHRKSSQGP